MIIYSEKSKEKGPECFILTYTALRIITSQEQQQNHPGLWVVPLTPGGCSVLGPSLKLVCHFLPSVLWQLLHFSIFPPAVCTCINQIKSFHVTYVNKSQ